MITGREIRREISLTKSLKKRFLEELKRLPEGKLYMKQERGTYRPYQRINGRENYLNRHRSEMIIGLANKKEIERALKKLENNAKLLEKLEREYTDIPDLMPETMDMVSTHGQPMQKTLQLLSKETLEKIAVRWLLDHNGNTDYLPERRIHRTSDGVYVRSKSELIIYEYLKSNGIPFVYEKPVMLQSQERYPDFTLVRKSDGKVLLWEHLGMMNDPGYFLTNIKKIYEYMENGYLPFKDMIISYDYEDGSIDLMELDRILRGLGFIE